MSTVVWLLLGVLVLSVVLAAVFAMVGRAAGDADRGEEREVLRMFGRLGRRDGERRQGTDRRSTPWLAVSRERRRGERRLGGDRRDPQSSRDDRADSLL